MKKKVFKRFYMELKKTWEKIFRIEKVPKKKWKDNYIFLQKIGSFVLNQSFIMIFKTIIQ